MNCPNCGNEPVGFMGTFYLRGVSFKKALQGFFRCRHCDTLLIQKKNESGFPQFTKPFWRVYSLFILGLLALTWIIFHYLESTIGSESDWFIMPVIVIQIAVLFVIMDRIRARYWILKETTFEEHEDEIRSQKLSAKDIIAFLIFGVLAISSFLFLDDFVAKLGFSPSAHTLSAIVYLMVIAIMAFAMMKYLTDSNSSEQE
jgi:hypothetical protein